MQETKPTTIRVWPVLQTYLRTAWQRPWMVVFAIASGIGAQVAAAIGPIYLKDIINAIATHSAGSISIFQELLFFVSIYGLIQIVYWMLGWVQDIATTKVEAHALEHLYNDAFEKLMRHSHEFFISNFTGTLTRRLTRYANAFIRIWDYALYQATPILVFTVSTVIVLGMQNLALGAGLLLWALMFAGLQILLVQRLQPLRLAAQEADSATTGMVSDAVTNHLAVTTYAALPHERTSFAQSVSNLRQTSRISWRAGTRLDALLTFFNAAGNVAILAGAIFFWQQGALTVGDFLLIQIYVMGLMSRIWGVSRGVRVLYEAFAEGTEMLDIIERPLDIVDAPGAKELTVTEGRIAFDQVGFGYNDDQMVLKKFNLLIKPHEKVAFVGLSGAGKTTVTKLLLRLYDVTTGHITIDGQDTAQATQESVRRAIAFVPQEPMLFHRSLMENIRYGRPSATDEEVIEAAKQAHCYEFISQYPDGFDTLVGERGVKLSGGERQRVSIARAILKDAPILVLDEATSSLDSESEHLIQSALEKLMEGKTVIAVAHRLSTIMEMDRIVVMERGIITTTGTHAELLARDENLYKKLWDIQAGGFLHDGN